MTDHPTPYRAAKFVCLTCGERYDPPTPTGDLFYCCGQKMQDNRPFRWPQRRPGLGSLRGE